MKYRTLFFDLDDTLYPASTGLWQAIRRRMEDYLEVRMGFSRQAIPGLRQHYYESYGTTLRGLLLHYEVNPTDYLDYVHDLPVEQLIRPDPQLRTLLLSLPVQPWIFTNADRKHADRVLAALELEGVFAGIVDVYATGFLSKPDPQAYWRALAAAGEQDPLNCVLLDDSPRNLAAARNLGFFTVLVGTVQASPAADLSLATPHTLRQSLPALWEPANGPISAYGRP